MPRVGNAARTGWWAVGSNHLSVSAFAASLRRAPPITGWRGPDSKPALNRCSALNFHAERRSLCRLAGLSSPRISRVSIHAAAPYFSDVKENGSLVLTGTGISPSSPGFLHRRELIPTAYFQPPLVTVKLGWRGPESKPTLASATTGTNRLRIGSTMLLRSHLRIYRQPHTD